MNKTIKKLHIQQQPKVITDYELLVTISWVNDPEMEGEAKKAFDAFCKRYHSYIKRVVNACCSKYLKRYGDEISKLVYSNTLIKIFEKAAVIASAMEKFSAMDAKTLKTKLKSYIGIMIRTELQAYLREKIPTAKRSIHHHTDTYYEGMLYEVDQQDEAENKLEYAHPLMEVFNKAFARLPQADQDFMRMVYLFSREPDQRVLFQDGVLLEDEIPEYSMKSKFDTKKNDVEKEKVGLDHESTELICEMFGLLPGNLRQKKKRLIAKIRGYMQEYINREDVA